MKTDNKTLTPVFRGSSLFYRNIQQSPRITWAAPLGGEHLGGKVKLEWKTQSPDIENIRYNLHSSKDSGATWQPLAADFEGKTKGESGGADKTGTQAAASWEWDTAKLPDGEYLLKVEGYWFDPLSQEKTSELSRPFFLCNTPPRIEITLWEIKNDRLLVKGFVTSSLAIVSGISCKIEKEEPRNILSADGMYDSTREEFSLDIPLPKAENLEIKVLDEAGNTKSLTRSVKP
jgi:hypothetical protein